MVKLLALLAKYLKKYLLDSFLAQTAPVTRFIVSVMLTSSIFIDHYVALGIFTAIVLLLVVCSLETLRENWTLLLMPIIFGILVSLVAFFWPKGVILGGLSPVLLVWKFFNMCLAALVFLILLPQRDVVQLARMIPCPQIWAATIACFRGVEIGAWALKTVLRTLHTKKIRFVCHPIVWLDAFSTGISGHFFEFLDGFVITLRTRGVESENYEPREGVKQVTGLDVLVIAICVVGLVGLVGW